MYIELPGYGPRYGDGKSMDKVRKTMFGTRDALQMRAALAKS